MKGNPSWWPNRYLPTSTTDARHSKTFLARLCEQAERYEEMVNYMKVCLLCPVVRQITGTAANQCHVHRTGSRQRMYPATTLREGQASDVVVMSV